MHFSRAVGSPLLTVRTHFHTVFWRCLQEKPFVQSVTYSTLGKSLFCHVKVCLLRYSRSAPLRCRLY